MNRLLKFVMILSISLLVLSPGMGLDGIYLNGHNNGSEGIALAAEKTKVTLVELGSLSCVPCRMMKPVLEQVEKKYPGQVSVVFIDVRTMEGRAEGARYNIRLIPTQVFLDSNGNEYFRHEGFYPVEDVEKVLRMKGVR